MVSLPTEPVPISGRVDRAGRLIAADPALERLQIEAGSALGSLLALPQLAALARSAGALGVPLSRAVIAADSSNDLDLFVRAEPNGDEVQLTIERWISRPASTARLTLAGPASDLQHSDDTSSVRLEFRTDPALNLINVSVALAALLGHDPDECVGQPLTALFRLVEEEGGSMPLLAAVAARDSVRGQRALARGAAVGELWLDAEPMTDAAGRFDGFAGLIRGQGDSPAFPPDDRPLEDTLDLALRSPLARIISTADRFVERSDGPLRSDYANYASDIAAAGRHLLAVIRSMTESSAAPAQQVDPAALSAEAIALVLPLAESRGIGIALQEGEPPMLVNGEARAIVQILVNILGNAVRHSPQGGEVAVTFGHSTGQFRATIADQGPGIAQEDQQRIFERYEQVGDGPEGSGLGLAISRRLARAMGGDIELVSAPGEGARFTLVLPA
ncbi:MAG TPA: HAMP domain-containing sensor histidine kinase [Sphingomicrobium sp.]|nr:HAMP domain-containing sensor histidine kinase [Sphingomicrobium sp.]